VLAGSIVDRFDDVARRFSDRLAVSDPVRQLTYRELAGFVDAVATAIVQAAGDRAGPVALLFAGDAYFPAALLGTLAAGRAFMPLDIRSPAARNRRIAAQSGASVIVTANDIASSVRSLFSDNLPLVSIDALANGAQAKRQAVSPNDVASIVYTSGSSGAPKGVYQNHRNLLHYIMDLTNSTHVNETDRVLLARSLNFVGAQRCVLLALLNGASLHVLPVTMLQPDVLISEIEARGITIFRLPPTLLRRIAEVLDPGRRFDSVRLIQLVSERSDWNDFDIFRRCFAADAHLMVGMGSTEGERSRWFVDATVRTTTTQLPVGRPLPDLKLDLVDEKGRLVIDGDVGEFVVASRHMALGYWRDPDATAQAFSTDPADPEIRIYKTGDLGRRRADGLFEFVGRKDRRIKLKGHRIEPEEIEAALRKYSGVQDCAVVVRHDHSGQPQTLAAYVEAKPGVVDLSPRDLTASLAQDLPAYMMPSSIVVRELPRLTSLKIDRIGLARMDADLAARMVESIDDPLIKEVAAVFRLVVGVDRASPTDNLSSLGGDSLQAVRIAVTLEDRFHVAAPPRFFEAGPTIADLANWIATHQA
jgi:fengycin family lipopeptide synthetase E